MQEKKLYYMCVARERTILADQAKSTKSKFQQFTNEILGNLDEGTYVLPYQE